MILRPYTLKAGRLGYAVGPARMVSAPTEPVTVDKRFWTRRKAESFAQAMKRQWWSGSREIWDVEIVDRREERP